MKTLTFTAAALFIFLGSCNLIENLIKIPIKLNSEVTIPAGTGIGVLVDLFSDETETNIEEELTLNDSRKDKIKTIFLKECVLTITSPSGQDFGFLNKIEVYLSDEELGDVLIASNNNIPDDVGNEITLSPNNVDVTEYIKKDSIKLLTKVTTDEVLLTNVQVNVFTRFRVTADIFR
jgi:hypothetical protein